MRLVLDQGAEVAAWVATQIPHMNGEGFGPSAAIGVVDALGRGVAGVVFHSHRPQYGDCMVSMASVSPKWLTKSLISGILSVPFGQYGANRITAITPPGATSVSRFLTKFGFRREGVIREGLGNQDAWIWGLLASEWRWSKFNLARPVSRGQVNPPSPGGARPKRRRKRSKRSEHSLGYSPATPQSGRVH